MKKLILTVAAALALGACQTTMPVYQAAKAPGSVGYSTAQADGDRYTVVYTGEKGMSRAQVSEYALLRAAELTMDSGKEWFAVLEASTRKVTLVDPDASDLTGKGELAPGSVTAGSGAPTPSTNSPGVGDAQVNLGPSTGGFGGGDVPYQVLERWTPPKGYQTTIVIQMGSGDQASFEGLDKEPEIYAAQAVSDEIRAKMAQ